jgi:hypothetical protein
MTTTQAATIAAWRTLADRRTPPAPISPARKSKSLAAAVAVAAFAFLSVFAAGASAATGTNCVGRYVQFGVTYKTVVLTSTLGCKASQTVETVGLAELFHRAIEGFPDEGVTVDRYVGKRLWRFHFAELNRGQPKQPWIINAVTVPPRAAPNVPQHVKPDRVEFQMTSPPPS